MQLPLQITFHGLEASAAIDTSIREHAVRLERFYDRITSCRVLLLYRTIGATGHAQRLAKQLGL